MRTEMYEAVTTVWQHKVKDNTQIVDVIANDCKMYINKIIT